jgi:hypothetical protein
LLPTSQTYSACWNACCQYSVSACSGPGPPTKSLPCVVAISVPTVSTTAGQPGELALNRSIAIVAATVSVSTQAPGGMRALAALRFVAGYSVVAM